MKLIITASLFNLLKNLHKLHCFLLLSNLCVLQLKKTLRKVIFFYFELDPERIFKAAGSGSAKNECGSTALQVTQTKKRKPMKMTTFALFS